jgi:hypothetical protein
MIKGATFREAACRADSVSAADLLRLHGRATWSGLLMVLSVLSMLPVAGVGTALSIPLFAIALRWPRPVGTTLNREFPVPARLLEMPLGTSWSRRCLHLFAAIYDAARATMRRRWLILRHPRTAMGWRIWIALMALLILLPLPFGNLLPGLSLALLSLGWSFKDGVTLTLSLVCGSAAMGYGVLSAHIFLIMMESVLAWWT